MREQWSRRRECSRQVGAGLAPALIDSAENSGVVQERKSGARNARYVVQRGHRIFPLPLWERVRVRECNFRFVIHDL